MGEPNPDGVGSLLPGTRIGPYLVVRRLGVGGMGEVFLGSDTRLERQVALKCLLSSAPADRDSRSRLMREARAAARITHPNVAAVHDVVEHDGRVFLVLEYVEGETLESRLTHGRLPGDKVVAIARQLASALSAAHAKGIVHRDLKPANVQITPEAAVKVLDFGIAQAISVATTAAAGNAATTRRDIEPIAGTPAYMAPEQLLGRPVDHRSDIFSLGVMLHEMATGRRRCGSSDPLSVPPPLQPLPRADAIEPGVPRKLADVIEKAVAIDPAARFQSATEFEAALAAIEARPPRVAGGVHRPSRRAIVIGAAVALALAAAVVLLLRGALRPEPASPAAASAVVAVLPLENLSGDASKEYLGTGVAETIMMALSKVRALTVISRSEVLDAMRRTRDPRKLARDLDASLLVDGSVQQAGDRLRITVRLVRTDGTVTWSDAYEDSTSALFTLQRSMASDLLRQLGGASPADGPELSMPSTGSVEALTAYWQGRSMLDRAVSPADFSAAVAQFRRATERDPAFALAYAGLGDTLWQQYVVTHDEALPGQALEAGLTALRLDPNQPGVRVAVATIYHGLGQYAAAEDELQHALALQPTSDDAHRILARVLLSEGKGAEAVREMQQAIATRPGRAIGYIDLGAIYFRLRQLPDAAAAYEQAARLQPDDPRPYMSLGAVYGQLGDTSRALDNLRRANRLVPSAVGLSNVGTIEYGLGHFDAALAAYGEAVRLNPRYALAHYNLGDTYRRLGRTDEAARAYRTARDLWLSALQVNDKDAPTLARLAVAEAKLGARAAADTHSGRAVAMAPDSPEIQYKRAVVDALAGRRDLALQALERALSLGFSAREARSDHDLASLTGTPAFVALVGKPD